jgi:hypothetical protein
VSLQSEIAYGILREALSSEHGIQIVIHDPPTPVPAKSLRAKSILLRFKNENPDEFGTLVIRPAPYDPNNRLWITKE